MNSKEDPSDTASNESSANRAVSGSSGGPGRRTFVVLIVIIVALVATVGVLAGLLAKANKENTSTKLNKSTPLNDSRPADTSANEEVDTTLPTNTETQGNVVTVAVVTPEHPLSVDEIELILASKFADHNFQFGDHHGAALRWTWTTYDSGMSEGRLIQRYVLACLFFATNNGTISVTDGVATGSTWSRLGDAPGSGWLGPSHECAWVGITCTEATESTAATATSTVRGWAAVATTKAADQEVTKIALGAKGLSGTLPKELLFLQDSLQHMDFFMNPSLSYNHDEGDDWLGQMTSLNRLFYGKTSFTSNHGVPSSIGKLTNLIEYDCSYTKYRGPLSGESFVALSNLEYAVLAGNAFGSSVPNELASLPKLEFLYLQDNALTGDLSFMIPMANTKMVEFWMGNNPGVSGEIPSEVGLITTLQSWSITNCNLTGTLPTELSNLPLVQFWCEPNPITGPSVTTNQGLELSC